MKEVLKHPAYRWFIMATVFTSLIVPFIIGCVR